MTRRTWLAVLAGGAVGGVLFLLMIGTGTGEQPGSARSRGAMGLWTAARYLEARGTQVVLRDAPLHTHAPEGTLVLAFPASEILTQAEKRALRDHLSNRRAIVFAYSGRGAGGVERQVAEELELSWVPLPGNPHLWPLSWWRQEREGWQVRVLASGGPSAVTLATPRALPVCERQSAVFLRGPGDEAVGYSYELRGGTVIVLPAELLANCRVAQPGVIAVLEGLRKALPGVWELDEWRHGFGRVVAGQTWASNVAFDLFVFQVLLVYALTIWMLARRFGPVWQEAVVRSGSVAGFLVAMGRLHERLGHHTEAARLLAERASELDREAGTRLAGPHPELSGSGLLEHGVRVARAQRWRTEQGG